MVKLALGTLGTLTALLDTIVKTVAKRLTLSHVHKHNSDRLSCILPDEGLSTRPKRRFSLKTKETFSGVSECFKSTYLPDDVSQAIIILVIIIKRKGTIFM